jgi:predicted  nucleic acid-binding Zn-ribbon protein
MPHQCVRCNTFYDDGAEEILKGCKCGARLFFYVRKDAVQKVKEMTADLTKEEKKEIEKDVYDLVDQEESEKPIILDIESIRVLKPGKFEIDLVHLFKKDPLVYKLGDGKYVIDLASVFSGKKEKEKAKEDDKQRKKKKSKK